MHGLKVSTAGPGPTVGEGKCDESATPSIRARTRYLTTTRVLGGPIADPNRTSLHDFGDTFKAQTVPESLGFRTSTRAGVACASDPRQRSLLARDRRAALSLRSATPQRPARDIVESACSRSSRGCWPLRQTAGLATRPDSEVWPQSRCGLPSSPRNPRRRP